MFPLSSYTYTEIRQNYHTIFYLDIARKLWWVSFCQVISHLFGPANTTATFVYCFAALVSWQLILLFVLAYSFLFPKNKQVIDTLKSYIYTWPKWIDSKAIDTLYRIDVFSPLFRLKNRFVKVWARTNVHWSAKIDPYRSQSEKRPYLSYNLQRSLLIWKYRLTNTRFCCMFCSHKSVQPWLTPFKNLSNMEHSTFYSGGEQNRNCYENSVPSVNRSPIWYTFCNSLFHCLV